MDNPEILPNVRVVLSHTTHPGNIGAAARAMKTMGLESLYLVNPGSFPDPKADMMACGAEDVLRKAVVCSSIDEALRDTVFVAAMTARLRDISHEVLTPREAMPLLVKFAAHNPVALLFGTEMAGLTNEEMGKSHVQIRIPANPEYSSLNLAAAVQVACYELSVAMQFEGMNLPQAEIEPARHEEVERMFVHLEQALTQIGFFRTKAQNKLMQKLRRLYARARLEQEEVNILRGILSAATRYNTRLAKNDESVEKQDE
ncbi:MAG: RNA methyltransferase [Nitrosomonadales bacterium]|nr:RNA methyltransferase [Nitrosomonadales bacterium]